MFFKCELLVGGYTYDVTNDLVNWDDVELAYKRDDYDGVVRSFSTKFQFANGAYSLLVGEWLKNYLSSAASIVYYKRNNSWLWNEVFRCALDFSTFTYNSTTCQINAVDSSIAAIIKAKRGTQYEYAVSGMKDEKQLYYDGLLMSAYAKWNWQGTEDVSTGDFYVDYLSAENPSAGQMGQISIYMTGNEFPFANTLEAYDGGSMVTDYGVGNYIPPDSYTIFKSSSEEELSVNLKIDLHLHVSKLNTGEIEYESNSVLFVMHKRPVGDSYSSIWSDNVRLLNSQTNHIDIEQTLEMKKGDIIEARLFIGTSLRFSQPSEYHETDIISVDTQMRNGPQLIDVVKPATLLNRLLKSMNGGNDGISGTIAEGVDERLDKTFLLAAESIRGLEGAKMYSSYTKFCEWMSAEFGFVPLINDHEKTVSFVHRNSLFVPTQTKDLGGDCTEFEYQVDSSMIYSRVRIGYDKQDYDSVNGRDEWRFTNEYTTGVTLTDNVFELISPYRADAYGIEFLAAKRGEETTDDDSDTDVFFVMADNVVNDDGPITVYANTWRLIRGGDYTISGVVSPETMFNVMYSQRYMIEANRRYMASFCNTLQYASADGNSEVVIGGMSGNADISLSDPLFSVSKVSASTGDMEILDTLDGSFDLTCNGKAYRGYLQDVSFNIGRGEEVRYTLIVWDVE